MTYLQGIISGAIITLVASFLGACLLCCFIKCVNTEFLADVSQFYVSEGSMEEGTLMTIKDFLTEFITHSLILGLVFTLVIAFLLKTKIN